MPPGFDRWRRVEGDRGPWKGIRSKPLDFKRGYVKPQYVGPKSNIFAQGGLLPAEIILSLTKTISSTKYHCQILQPY